jgi:RNA polymerase sigma-70 factor (ECF subfamily)
MSEMVQAAVSGTNTGAQGVVDMTPPVLPICSFEDLVERHQQEIYRYSLQLTSNSADADDLYQETLMKAFRAFGRLDGNANHRAWLYKICTNTFLSSRRKLGRESALDETMEMAIPAEQTDHASSLDARDLLRDVEAFVTRLPDKQRIALILRKYHDAGYDQIASTLNCSEAAARANVHEALRKLRDCFGDRL